jgi:hypothetical protein
VRDSPAQGSPSSLVGSERDDLLSTCDQMGPQNRAHSGCGAGVQKLDGAVYPIGIGTRQRAKATLGCRHSERLGTGDTEPEGEMGVNVEVGEHLQLKT